ncbi:hypothetical protein GCM10011519_13890 [Marmoricola endophyticus]|uniref:SMP-30/Gluconolactonase/LRE-like region domain-containing protein n=1 Tax=Marmoricola endophyticus TaxID=2040280 RepID=A0A917BIC3_9ACTN|nr:NHL repeat-containing protein [Marmoricola endophyticus]GGF41344.1 hypothetical protein GCM10011519_13890 [Marmoricola endophyticus]
MPTTAPPTRRFAGQLGRTLTSPAGLALDPSTGDLWVADTFAGVVHRYDRHRRLAAEVGRGRLAEPRDVSVAEGRAYVVDSALERVEVFDLAGAHVATLGRGRLVRPRGVAVETASGVRVLVSDVGGNRVARIDPDADEVVASLRDGVHTPHGLHVGADGSLLVVSSSRQYDGDGGVTRYVDDARVATYGEGQQSTFGAMSNPAHAVAEPDGSVWVSVPDYGFVQHFAADGTFLEEIGTSGAGLLRQPLGLALSADGELLVADSGGHRVARFAPVEGSAR